MHELPSEEELLAGRMKNGSRPPLHSRHLYDPWTEPLPIGEDDKPAIEQTAEDLHFEVELQRLDGYQECEADAQWMVNNGKEIFELHKQLALKEEATEQAGSEDTLDEAPEETPEDAPEQTPETAPQETSPEGADKPAPMRGLAGLPGLPEDSSGSTGSTGKSKRAVREQRKQVRKQRVMDVMRKPRPRPANPYVDAKTGKPTISASVALALVERGIKLKLSILDKRAACAHGLIDMATQKDKRQLFLEDRAHAVIASLLMHLDEEFEEVGFGGWMPFRFPDQWLMFCGIMKKVLAANGLIHSKHADTYRRLLDETPPVEVKGSVQDRKDWWNTPENWSTCWTNRGALNLKILKQRLMDEVWDPTTQFGGTRAPPQY